MHITDETNTALAETFGTGEWDNSTVPGMYVADGSGKRMLIRFDTETYRIGKGWTKTFVPFKDAVLLQYVRNDGARTPSGGKFTSHRLTIRTKDGRKWVGQMKKDSNIVKMRLSDS